MSQIRASTSKLIQLHKKLLQDWEAVSLTWTDSYARQFERVHWQPLDSEIRQTLREMENLAKTVEDAGRHTSCGR